MALLAKVFFQFIITPLYLHANEPVVCEMINNPNASTLKIDYLEKAPYQLSLRSPNEDVFRVQNVKIEVVFQKNENGEESFLAKPMLSQPVDWSKEPNCFKEIGTQWYFIFHHQMNSFYVQLIPYFITSHPTCILPRYKPQTQPLYCM